MAAPAETQPFCEKVSLHDIYSSIRISVENILPRVFGAAGLPQGSIVLISGPSSSGKTSLIKEIVIESLLQKADVEVLLLDADKDIRVLPIIRSCIERSNHGGPTEDFSDRLNILTCYESEFEAVVDHLEENLADNQKISIILLDSLGFYYSQSGEGEKIKSKENYLNNYLQKFAAIAKKFNVTIVCSLPGFITKIPATNITHTIELKARNQQPNLMIVTSKQSSSYRETPFTLCADGINFEAQ